MAKYQSHIKISGSIGGVTYYECEGENIAKEKGSPSDYAMKYGDKFAKSRRCAAEFQGATAVTKQLRDAMGNLTTGVRSVRVSSNMTSWLLKAAHTDPVSDWGERKVWLGDLSLLQGFEFNQKLLLDDALPVKLLECCKIMDGKATVSMPGFRLRYRKHVPDNATHFRMVSAVLYLDAGKKTYQRDLKEGALWEIGNKPGPAFEVKHEVQAKDGQLVFWLVGIEYHGMGKKRMEVLKGGAIRVMACGLGGLVDYERLTQEISVVEAQTEEVGLVDGREKHEEAIAVMETTLPDDIKSDNENMTPVTRSIVVPKDKVAMEALDYDQATSDQLYEVKLDEGLFERFWRTGIPYDINLMANINLDIAKDDQITDLEDLQKIVASSVFDRGHPDESVNTLLKEIKELFMKAIDCRTGIFFFF